MYRKTCTRCGKDSYSASTYGSWRCPHCDENLTNEVARPAEPEDKNPHLPIT